MAYRFKRKEDVDDGVCRIAAERVERAISRLKRSRNPLGEAVHEVRMDIKKLRALLRLVRQAIGKKTFQREAAALREAAACLAAVRDARMKVQTIQRLIKHFDGKASREPFPRITDKLQRNCDQESRAFVQNRSA